MFGERNGNKICVSIKEAYEINKKWKIINYALEELEKENFKLKEEIKSLKEEIKRQNEIIKDYEKDEPFFNTIDRLKHETENLKKENRLLKKRNSFLLKVNSSLFSILSDLENQNKKLIKESVIAKKQYELETKKILLKIDLLKEEIKNGHNETDGLNNKTFRSKQKISFSSGTIHGKITDSGKKSKTDSFDSIDVKV